MKDEKLELLLDIKQEYKNAWLYAKEHNKKEDVLRKIEEMRLKLDHAIIDYIRNTVHASDTVKSVDIGVPLKNKPIPVKILDPDSDTVCPTCNTYVRGAHYCPGPKAHTAAGLGLLFGQYAKEMKSE